jgi:hypothetical protein
MPEVIRLSRQVGDNVHELTINWDAKSFEEGTPRIDVRASIAAADYPSESRSIEAAVSLEANEDGAPDIVLRSSDREMVRLSLADLIDESQIIDKIPGWIYGAGDPILGCLIRAGLSAVVGQIIRCTRKTRDLCWYSERIRGIGLCLRSSAGRMTTRMVLRAVRCIALAGH